MSRSVTAFQGGHQALRVAPGRPRRDLHPGAWWGWAVGAAVVASLTRNPLVLALVVAALSYVVVARRTDAAWARSARLYLLLAATIIGIRLVFQMLVGGLREGHVLFRLPRIDLPAWAAGIQIGGPVTAEGLWFTVCDAGRLAVLVWCVGAANTLANPRRLLRTLPHAAHRLATAVAIAVSSAPQLVESTQRVAAPGACAGVTPPGRMRCGASSSRCSRTPSTGRCRWPRRWSPADSARITDPVATARSGGGWRKP